MNNTTKKPVFKYAVATGSSALSTYKWRHHMLIGHGVVAVVDMVPTPTGSWRYRRNKYGVMLQDGDSWPYMTAEQILAWKDQQNIGTPYERLSEAQLEQDAAFVHQFLAGEVEYVD